MPRGAHLYRFVRHVLADLVVLGLLVGGISVVVWGVYHLTTRLGVAVTLTIYAGVVLAALLWLVWDMLSNLWRYLVMRWQESAPSDMS